MSKENTVVKENAEQIETPTEEVKETKAKKPTVKKTATATKNIYQKLKDIQTTIKAPKNLRNNFGGYNYRNAEGILESVKPYLEKEDCLILLEDEIVVVGDRYYVKAIAKFIDCENGDEISVSALAREMADKKGMDSSQVTGSTSSYARKYALNGLLLLDDTKDADTDEYAKVTGSANSNSGRNNFQSTPKASNNNNEEKW